MSDTLQKLIQMKVALTTGDGEQLPRSASCR
jgi:hypothetical protein